MSAGRLAFANVRARARAARLHGPEMAAHLRAARDPAARAAALRKLGAEGGEVLGARLAALLGDYAVLAESYPVGGSLIVALARLHELENLKLLFRAAQREIPADRWRHRWRPMGRLGTLRLADAEEVRSLRDLPASVAATPYAEVVSAAVTGALDAATAELSFDRLGSRRLVEEADALPRAHADAAALVLDLVRERDLDALRRARAYGIAPALAAGATVLLPRERGFGDLAEIAAWKPDDGPLGKLLPRTLLGGDALVADWNALTIALRRRRRHACAAAFIGSPLRLAPGIAYLLLAEEEVRGLVSLAEAAGDPSAGEVLARALAGSALGD
jgi:hypothetical protein